MATRMDLFTRIAQMHLHIETLVQRNLDSLDFHDVGVIGVQRALDSAFRAGQAELLAAAEELLASRESPADAANAWQKLERAVSRARKHDAIPAR